MCRNVNLSDFTMRHGGWFAILARALCSTARAVGIPILPLTRCGVCALLSCLKT
ncbi:hypothetical protein [Abditibacterium utsteinense]|uniref:hypothetical protein n=1 Tax=Abditibacterium utsteinense TaxID=1960156 RepID=UPI0013004A9C|nr:hypothetical protein [Abditibacterium utsteinense]